jgi:hypothetical protein
VRDCSFVFNSQCLCRIATYAQLLPRLRYGPDYASPLLEKGKVSLAALWKCKSNANQSLMDPLILVGHMQDVVERL